MISNYREMAKRVHALNVPFTFGELTVLKGDDAENIMKHSCQLTGELLGLGIGSLTINCGISKQRFYDEWSKTVHKKHQIAPYTSEFLVHGNETNLKAITYYHTVVNGNLIGDSETIEQFVRDMNVRVVILTGWEWSASGSRRRERLLYFLRELMHEYHVSVVVYSQRPLNSRNKKIDRPSISRLLEIAYDVVDLTGVQITHGVTPLEKPIYVASSLHEAADEAARYLSSLTQSAEGVGTYFVESDPPAPKGWFIPDRPRDDDDEESAVTEEI